MAVYYYNYPPLALQEIVALKLSRKSISFRIFLLTEPITKDARTGNRLMTGFRVPEDGTYTPDSLESLYKNKELDKEQYRTYIMSRIYGPLRKISRLPQQEIR